MTRVFTKQLAEALSRLPQHLRSELESQLHSPNFSGYLTTSANPTDSLEALVSLATLFAKPLISNFHVGALAIGTSGRLYFGANLEFPSLPLSTSLHAEQSAILNAWLHRETGIRFLAVSEAPCGHCRQFLYELPKAAALPIWIRGETLSLQNLLPHNFGGERPAHINLLTHSENRLVPAQKTDKSPLSLEAIDAARKSYTPYTPIPEGVALKLSSNQIISGSLAQSSAFNPTVPAIVSALNQLNLSSQRDTPVIEASYAFKGNTDAHHLDLTHSILRRLGVSKPDTIKLMEEV